MHSPIFVIGSYRSGTSVLTWCLGQHRNILPLEETYWIYQHSLYTRNLYELGQANCPHSHLSTTGLTLKDFYRWSGNFVNMLIADRKVQTINSARNLLKAHGLLAAGNYEVVRDSRDPKLRWVDGTPENSHFTYGILNLFPDAKFIHILRNPRDVARSLMNFSTAGGKDYEENAAYQTWSRLVRACKTTEDALGSSRVMRIDYEKLIEYPEETLRRCLLFLGEDYDPNCELPLNEKINSSQYTSAGSQPVLSVSSRQALELYEELKCSEVPEYGTKSAYRVWKGLFVSHEKHFTNEGAANEHTMEIYSTNLTNQEQNKWINRALARIEGRLIFDARNFVQYQNEGENAIYPGVHYREVSDDGAYYCWVEPICRFAIPIWALKKGVVITGYNPNWDNVTVGPNEQLELTVSTYNSRDLEKFRVLGSEIRIVYRPYVGLFDGTSDFTILQIQSNILRHDSSGDVRKLSWILSNIEAQM